MKRILALTCAALAVVCLSGPASAQRFDRGQGPGRFAPETESETNSMTWLLGRGYQVVAGWDGTLVLQRADRIYLCPITRYRTGNDRDGGRLISQPCQHVREGMQP